MKMVQPPYWKAFIESEGLVGKLTAIPEADDRSGLGAEVRWFDEEGSRSEKEDFYPGITVAHDGFIPVGECDFGSGDPYFICKKDGVGGPLYRIYHDSVGVDGYSREDAVVVVLPDYREITRFKQ